MSIETTILTNLFSVFPGVSSVPLTPLFSLDNKSFMNNIDNFLKSLLFLDIVGYFVDLLLIIQERNQSRKTIIFVGILKIKGVY